MSEKAIADKMARAGVDVNRSRAYVLMCDVLKECSGDLDAVHALADQVWRDMNRTPERTGQNAGESHRPFDRPSPATNGNGARQSIPENQPCHDRVVAAAKPQDGSQPATGRRHFADPVPAAPRTKISKAAAAAVAKSFWDRNVGIPEVSLRTCTRKDWETLWLKSVGMNHTAKRMLVEIAWPDDVTPLPAVANEGQVKEILESGKMAIESAKGTMTVAPRGRGRPLEVSHAK